MRLPKKYLLPTQTLKDISHKKIKTEVGLGAVVKMEIILGQDGVEQVIMTQLLKVSKVRYINELPCCWPMLEELVAYVLDLSGEEQEWMNSKGKSIGMDSVIWEHVNYHTASYSLLMANLAGSGQLGW